MTFIIYGINYKTAPLAIRERLAKAFLIYQQEMQALLLNPQIQEAMILSTCNRTEFYLYAHSSTSFLNDILQASFGDEASSLISYFYRYEHKEALQHLLEVAVGIDSMMIGEPQILGQLKQAMLSAQAQHSIKKHLKELFAFVFKTSKSIRTQSGIGHNPVSIASAAARFIQSFFPDVSTLHFFIIGSGETARLVTKYLIGQGASSFTIASRTFEHAQDLSSTLQGKTVHLYDIPNVIHSADVVITATSCPLSFIDKHMIESALIQRQNHPMLMIDLSIPRNIDPDVGDLPLIELINIDDLHACIQTSLNKRKESAKKATLLIEKALDDYTKTMRAHRANPVISDYRAYLEHIATLELHRAEQKLLNGHCHFNVLNEFSKRLINKLSHLPTLALRKAAVSEQEDILQFAHALFRSLPEEFSHEEIN